VKARAADPTAALAWLAPAAQARRAAGLHRELRARPVALDLAGNDYLGLSRNPRVLEAAGDALRAWGAGSTGSRLVTGTTAVHLELEDALAAHTGAEAALVVSSGYLANLAAVTALSGPGTLVVSDEANHASVVDACRLSRARVTVVPHGDVAAAAEALRIRDEERALLVTDAVFSVSGRLAPLRALHAAARETGALLVVDEAHALGVIGPTGRGAAAAAGLAGEPDIVLTVTLSKSLGSQGGAVLGPAAVREHLVDTARPVIFDTALAPSAAAAALAALRLVDDLLVRRLHDKAAALADAIGVPAADGAILPAVVGDAARADAARNACLAAGVLVGCFRPPSVPHGGSCLRLTARAELTAADVAFAADVIRRSLAEVSAGTSPHDSDPASKRGAACGR
jgi:8-amino-7-oxononanoate synthase